MKLSTLLFLEDNNHDPIPNFEFYEFHIVRFSELKNQNDPFGFISSKIRKHKAVNLCTIGLNPEVWIPLFPLHFEWRKRWIHVETLSQLNDSRLTFCYLGSNIHQSNDENPIISVITTTFHSGKKFLRPLESLKNQTYNNWEWIIWDDSKDDKTYHEILKHAEQDIRIQCYKAPQHSGFIGEMKRLSSSLAKGKWLVELDHDDIIIPDLFQMIVDIDKKYPEADFVFSDCIELFENTEEPFHYGEYFAFGYGCYYKKFLRGKYHNVAPPPKMNPTTIRYIVGVPNHVRIWKSKFYHEIGRHFANLPVVDDYELIVRTFLESKNWVRIAYPCYYQYRNEGGNNFTFLRNALIQYITRWVSMIYEKKIDDRVLELGWKNEIKKNEVAWERKEEDYSPMEKIFHPYSEETITFILPCFNNIHEIEKSIETIVSEHKNPWIMVIGDCCPQLSLYMNRKITNPNHPLFIHKEKIHWWNLYKRYNDDFETCIRYAKKMILFTEKFEIIKS